MAQDADVAAAQATLPPEVKARFESLVAARTDLDNYTRDTRNDILLTLMDKARQDLRTEDLLRQKQQRDAERVERARAEAHLRVDMAMQLKAIREHLGLSQGQMSALLSVPVTMVANAENGKVGSDRIGQMLERYQALETLRTGAPS